MNDVILSALKYTRPDTLSYLEWLLIGMALKEEGYSCSVWDNWSSQDVLRYHPDDCAKKWRSFQRRGTPVKGGTIIKIAKDHGWTPLGENGCLDWTDTISNDDNAEITPPESWESTSELIEFLDTLFDPDDLVGYVTTDAWQGQDGKWHPGKITCDRSAKELIASLKKYPEDIGATIGDWVPEAGAWIRINPVDGNGMKDENVTDFRYALIESDTLSVAEQEALYNKLELPIATLVNSGGKSLHAVVKIDAADKTEYDERVNILYTILEKNGFIIDKQNRNPSRLSRMPGVTRGGNRQNLIATNLGRESWADWIDAVEDESDEFPDMVSLSSFKDNPPTPPDELIEGILRCGHKMLISGSSKAGKSFLLMQLCIAIAEGTKWLEFKCKKGRVLYVNLEIDSASSICRFLDIYQALNLPMENAEDIIIWNLRGHAVPLDKLVPNLIKRAKNHHFDAIVIDPIYKVITGDENNATEMAKFCNLFDQICTDLGCATIYCHHHSKGAQGGKRAMDRASGSGVFARDPDAQLDVIQLEVPEELKNDMGDEQITAWRLESSLREFANIEPVNFWYDNPIHRVDTFGILDGCGTQGSAAANLSRSSKRTTSAQRKQKLDNAYNECQAKGVPTVREMANQSGLSEKSIRRYIEEFESEYSCNRGIVTRTL